MGQEPYPRGAVVLCQFESIPSQVVETRSDPTNGGSALVTTT